MIKHIVFWQLKEEHEGHPKAELAQNIKTALEDMATRIPVLQHLEVGIGVAKEDMAADIALYSEFATWDDLQTYQDHPEHVKFKGYIGSLRTERRVIDYEV